jgi:hypothetical protein
LERKWLWPNLKYKSGIYLEGLKKKRRKPVRIISVPAGIQTGLPLNTSKGLPLSMFIMGEV